MTRSVAWTLDVIDSHENADDKSGGKDIIRATRNRIQKSRQNQKTEAPMLIYCLQLLAAFFMLPADPKEHESLSLEQVRVIRDAVYRNDAKLYSPDGRTDRLLDIPPSLGALYKTHPSGVLNVLEIIIEGANPKDSRLATGYALELLKGPGAGVVCVEFGDKNKYDIFDDDWGTTPRLHYLNKFRSARSAKRLGTGSGPID